MTKLQTYKYVSIRLPAETWMDLRQVAFNEGLSMNAMVVKSINEQNIKFKNKKSIDNNRICDNIDS